MLKNLREDITISNFEPTDYNGLIDLWELTDLGRPERGDDLNVILKSIEMGGQLFLIKQKTSKKIIGCSWITFDGRRLFLHHFGIHPENQKKGYGKILAEHSILFAKDKNIQLKLEVHKENEAAIKLYSKLGFKFLGDYDIYIIRNYN